MCPDLPTNTDQPPRRIADDPVLAQSLDMVLARAFGSRQWSSREELLWAAMTVWAPTAVVEAIQQLPRVAYQHPAEVRAELLLPDS